MPLMDGCSKTAEWYMHRYVKEFLTTLNKYKFALAISGSHTPNVRSKASAPFFLVSYRRIFLSRKDAIKPVIRFLKELPVHIACCSYVILLSYDEDILCGLCCVKFRKRFFILPLRSSGNWRILNEILYNTILSL